VESVEKEQRPGDGRAGELLLADEAIGRHVTDDLRFVKLKNVPVIVRSVVLFP
jgi:hypothetical protein